MRTCILSDAPSAQRLQRIGVGLAFAGVVVDAILFLLWIGHSPVTSADKLHLASMAQGLLIDGLLLALTMRIHRLLLASTLTPSVLVSAGF
jgi:hypothetical protein